MKIHCVINEVPRQLHQKYHQCLDPRIMIGATETKFRMNDFSQLGIKPRFYEENIAIAA